jgi:hypothetical protein
MLNALHGCFTEYEKFYKEKTTKFNLKNLEKQIMELLESLLEKMSDKRGNDKNKRIFQEFSLDMINTSDIIDEEERQKILEAVGVIEDEITAVNI